MGGRYYTVHANPQKLCSPPAALYEQEKKHKREEENEEKHDSVPGKAEAGERSPKNDTQQHAMAEQKLREKVAAGGGVQPGVN